MQERKDASAPRGAIGAHSPEELATWLEDAFIVRDPGGLADPFDEHAARSPPGSDVELRGSAEIARFAAAQWGADRGYVAEVRRAVQAGDVAAVIVDWSLTGPHSLDGKEACSRGVDVLRRGSDGAWRYVISLMDVCS